MNCYVPPNEFQNSHHSEILQSFTLEQIKLLSITIMIILSIDCHIMGVMRVKSPEGEKDIELSLRMGGGGVRQSPL
jgi:hypothetical protein